MFNLLCYEPIYIPLFHSEHPKATLFAQRLMLVTPDQVQTNLPFHQ